jgi:tetratricopeptide (TPR) repeat protein
VSSPSASGHHQVNVPLGPKEDKDVADRTWILKSAARKFKEAVRSAPGGRVEILALSYVLYQRATMNPTIEKAVRHLDIARHKLQYLLRTYPDDRVAFVLFADVVQLSAELRNNVDLMHQAISHYLQHLSTQRHDAHASYQCGKSYLSIYYFSGKKPEMLQAAHNMAKTAVEYDPNSGEAFYLLARTSSLLASKERDLAAYTLCEEAFQKAHLLFPTNVYVLYQWGALLLRKASAFDSVDALLSAALKLKTAVEREPKIDHYNSVRECISALEDKLTLLDTALPSSSSSSNLLESTTPSLTSASNISRSADSVHLHSSSSHHNLNTSQHASAVAGWAKTLRQALERWQQQHQHDHGGESHMIDWEDIDVRLRFTICPHDLSFSLCLDCLDHLFSWSFGSKIHVQSPMAPEQELAVPINRLALPPRQPWIFKAKF